MGDIVKACTIFRGKNNGFNGGPTISIGIGVMNELSALIVINYFR